MSFAVAIVTLCIMKETIPVFFNDWVLVCYRYYVFNRKNWVALIN